MIVKLTLTKAELKKHLNARNFSRDSISDALVYAEANWNGVPGVARYVSAIPGIYVAYAGNGKYNLRHMNDAQA